MRCTSHILFWFTAWIGVFTSSLAKDAVDPELLREFTKDVETVLSPALIGELQGAQSNRSAINVEQTSPRNAEQSSFNVNDRKPDIKFDNQVYPYHYERSYHYHYPPNPNDDSSGPVGYSEHFYEPRFRPKSHVPDNHHPSYYRSELYNPFGTSAKLNADSNVNSNPQTNTNTNDNAAVIGDAKEMDNSGAGEVLTEATPLPPNSFTHPEISTAPPYHYPFPSVDFGSHRHGGFGRPLVNNNYFGPNGHAGQQLKEPPAGYYLPQGDGRISESLNQRPVALYPRLAPLIPQTYIEHRPSLTESSPHRSEHLAPPFFGSFFPPGYQSPFYNGHQPSDHYNNLFSENFTRNFPPGPSFGGFYPHNNYLPPPPSPTTGPPELKPEEPLPPGGPSSQPIPTTKPEDPATPVAAASNSNYEWKLFFPTKNDANPVSQPSAEKLAVINENVRI